MAPPRLVVKQQLEVMIDFLEEHRDVANGLAHSTPMSHQTVKEKWAVLAKKLNAVQGGVVRPPEAWKRYWFEFRHKSKKKATNIIRLRSGEDPGKRHFPLNDLELRALELSGKGVVQDPIPLPNNKQSDSFLDDSDEAEQPHEPVTLQPDISTNIKPKKSYTSSPKISTDDPRCSPPPKWALELEQRRIAAEERVASALESMSSLMRAQEERRAVLEQRTVEALAAIAGTLQDLNSGVHEAVHHLQRVQAAHLNDADVKDNIFI